MKNVNEEFHFHTLVTVIHTLVFTRFETYENEKLLGLALLCFV